MTRPSGAEWREEWRLGWPPLLGASIGLATGSAMFAPTASLFAASFHKAFGWSQLEISSAQSLGLAGSILAPVMGILVNRLGLRRMALGATGLLCLAYAGFSLMTGSLPLFCALCILLSLASCGASGIVYGRVVTSWFDRSRGLALAASRAGPAVIGSLTPLLLYRVIETHGWRAGYWTLILVTLVLGLPAIVWLVREPDAPAGAAAAQPPALKVSVMVLLKDARLWSLLLVAFLLNIPLLGLTVHLHPLLTTYRMSGEAAAGVIGAFSSTILAGTFISGLLMDRYGPRVVGAVFLASAIVGFTALATVAHGPAGATAAVLLVGLNQGVENDLLAFLIVQQFGRVGFSPVYGMTLVAIGLAGVLGASGFGALRDHTGGYDAGLWLGVACLLGAITALLAGASRQARPAPERPARAEASRG